jgi:hypothetical protein
MAHGFRALEARSTEIDGSSASAPEENFRPALFGDVARVIWRKPDAAIADIAGVSDRAARDYLSGRVPAPAIVIAAIVVALTRRN